MKWTHDPEIRTWLPKLQSHRGFLLGGAQQNTLASVKAAYELGYEIAEFDVRLTADNICILFHDSDLNGVKIKLNTLATLRAQTGISTLEEVLGWLTTVNNFKLNIEIKSRDVFEFELERCVSALIRKFRLEKRVMISSFNPFSLYKIRMFSPKVYRAILVTLGNDHGNNIFTRTLSLNFLCRPHMLNLRYSDYSDKFRLLAQKVPVVLWTVNDLAFYHQVKSEIHGIISDDITPAALKEIPHAQIH